MGIEVAPQDLDYPPAWRKELSSLMSLKQSGLAMALGKTLGPELKLGLG